MPVKTEEEASCDVEAEEVEEEEVEEAEEEEEEEGGEEASLVTAFTPLGEALLQQTGAVIKTYTKHGYRFIQHTLEAYSLKSDPAIRAMLEQQHLTGLVESIPCKIDEERCADFMRTFNFHTKSGRVKGTDGEFKQVTLTADLISRALNVPNRGRETQLKNTASYYRHVVASGCRPTCDGVKYEDIIDPHVQRKARFLQMLIICTFRSRNSRVLKSNLARICAPQGVYNWASLIATELALGCKNLTNRSCICGPLLTRVIYTHLGLSTEPFTETNPLARGNFVKIAREVLAGRPGLESASKRKSPPEETPDKQPKCTAEADRWITDDSRFLPHGGSDVNHCDGGRKVGEDLGSPVEAVPIAQQVPDSIQQQDGQQPPSSSFSSERKLQVEGLSTPQATHSSSTISLRSRGLAVKDSLNTTESRRKKTQPDSQGDDWHIEMDSGPSVPSLMAQEQPQAGEKQHDPITAMSKEEQVNASKRTPEVDLQKSSQQAKVSKTNQQAELRARPAMVEVDKVPDSSFVPALRLLQDTVKEGMGSGQEKGPYFYPCYPWYPTAHPLDGQTLWHGAEKALWDQALAIMHRLRGAQEAGQQRLDEAERRAQNSLQRSINLEQAYQALELQMKIQQAQYDALENQHTKLIKDHATLKEKTKDFNLQVHYAQVERDRALGTLKSTEARVQTLEEDIARLRQLYDKTVQEKNTTICNFNEVEATREPHERSDHKENEDRALQLQARLDNALQELEAGRLRLKEVQGQNVFLQEQKAQLEAALEEKEHDFKALVTETEALLPDLEKLAKKYQSYKRQTPS